MSLRILSAALVQSLLPMAKAIDVNAQAFIHAVSGDAVIPSRLILPVPEHSGATLFKPALIHGHSMGVKIVSVRPKNDALGLPSVPAVVMLFNIETGLPECIMDGTYLTALRTAAGSGAATRQMASENSTQLLVFGAGLQAKLHIHAMLAVRAFECGEIRPLEILKAQEVDFNPAELALCFPTVVFREIPLDQTTEVEQSVRVADVIVTATNTSTPLFNGDWLKPGCHINGIGSYTPQMQELDANTMRRSKIVLDSEGARQAGDIAIPWQAGVIGPANVFGELGQILTNAVNLHSSNPILDVTVFKSVGTAIQDVMTAQAVYSAALEGGVGVLAEL